MSTLSITKPIAEIAQRGRIRPETVLELRRKMYSDGHIGPAEADQLFYLDTSCGEVCPEWNALFVEALTDFLVHQVAPRGYVSVANANWLIQKVDLDGRVETNTEMELLLNVVETAKMIPPVLSEYVIHQVGRAVVENDGPTRNGKVLQPGTIGAGEVEVLRRTLYAAGGAGHTAVTREEAEMLFDINDATKHAENDPAWSDLFVKAIANFLMAAHGYSIPSRQDALRREKWVEDAESDFGGMTGQLVGGAFSSRLVGGLRGVWADLTSDPTEEAYGHRHRAHEALISVNEHITEEEAKWLSERIARDGELDENETALLLFIQSESPEIHPVLKPLMDMVA
ncbi:MAG: hypothetical protein AAF441_07975 [Pseudomonadota bacterium]